GPPPVAEVSTQNRQALLQLLTAVEGGPLAIEFFLQDVPFQAYGALYEILQTTSLVPQQTLHFLDEVQNNARFLGQHPAELVATRREISRVRKGRYAPGELVFHKAAEAQDGQITTPQEVEGTGLTLGLAIAVDDAAIDADKGRIDHGCPLGAA